MRYTLRRGPLVVYAEDNGISRAVRNLPGVESYSVERMNLLKLAPGGTFGRFIIWTEGAFKKLNDIYGSLKSGAPMKKGYRLPRAMMENADVARIINSDEVQSVLRPKLEAPKHFSVKKNPLKNPMVMARLNPGALQKRAMRKRAHDKSTPEGQTVQKKVKASAEAHKKHNRSQKGDERFYQKMMSAYEAASKAKETAKDDDEE